MNIQSNGAPDDLKAFQLLSEVADEQPVSQRELAKRLGIALGLVNSYLKNFVTKGYIRIKNYPHNRYAYLLTPNGMAEKARLAYQHLSYFTNLYTMARHDYLELFRHLEASGIRQVVFCGVDEVAEIAYLSLQETGLELAGVVDDKRAGTEFFQLPIRQLVDWHRFAADAWILTSLKRRHMLRDELLDLGVSASSIFSTDGVSVGTEVRAVRI